MAQDSHPYDAMAKVVARSNRVLSFVLTPLLFHMDVMLSVAVRAIAKRLVTSVLQLHSFVCLYRYSKTSNAFSPLCIFELKVVFRYHFLGHFLAELNEICCGSLLNSILKTYKRKFP